MEQKEHLRGFQFPFFCQQFLKYIIKNIFVCFLLQLETDKLALPMSPSPLSPSPIPSPNTKLENSTLLTVEPSPLDKNKGFFVDESEPLLRCDSTSSGSSALSRTGSFITKGRDIGRTAVRSIRSVSLPQRSPRGFSLASSTIQWDLGHLGDLPGKTYRRPQDITSQPASLDPPRSLQL